MNRRILFALLITCATCIFAARPNVQFGPEGVTVFDVRPGTKVAWISLTRTRVAEHTSLRIDRGVEVATPSKKAVIARPDADKSRALWVVAAIDDDIAGVVTSPRYSGSQIPIAVTSAPGSDTISITSPEIELMYVRPNGGAWFIRASDGGLGDADGRQDTLISVPLQSLERVQGNPHPPDSLHAGDMILMLDPRGNRTAVIKVGE